MTAQNKDKIIKWFPMIVYSATLIWAGAIFSQNIKENTKCIAENKTDIKLMTQNVNLLCVQMAELATEMRLSRERSKQ